MLNLVSQPSLGERLIAGQRRIDSLELEQARLVAEFAESEEWRQAGFDHPIEWLRFNCHLTSTQAIDLCNLAEHLCDVAETVEAMKCGEIGFAHVKVMARTCDAVGKAFDERKLLALARANSPGKFHFQCLHYRHAVDPGRYARDEFEKYERRHLRLSRWEDGSLILSGVLDPAGGVALRTVLEPLARRSGEHDDRNREQRLADALVALAASKLNVHIQVTSSVETLLGLVGAPGAENEFSLPISSQTVQRWACDSNLSRVLMQDSVVIDVGRSRRVVSAAARRALVARDGHCRWPGCDRPASWCDGHHLVSWIGGGATDLDNLVLLCGRHHRMVHEGGWQLVKTDGAKLVTIAPTVTFGRPRAPD